MRSYEEIAKALTHQQASTFLQKWVVEQGHTSIAEHIPISLFLEDVPLIVATWLESFPGIATLSRSTRHQKVERRYMQCSVENLYTKTIDVLFDAYEKLLPNYEKARMLLPLGTLTSMALTTNAAVLLKILADGALHYLPAVRETCSEIRKVAAQISPILFSLPMKGQERRHPVTQKLSEAERAWSAAVVGGTSEAEKATPAVTQGQPSVVLRTGCPSDDPRHSFFTFEFFLDFPTLRDLLHIRRGVVTLCPFTTVYGYDKSAVSQDVAVALDNACKAIETLAKEQPHEAVHLIPMAFRQRVLYSVSVHDMIEQEEIFKKEGETGGIVQVFCNMKTIAYEGKIDRH